MRTSGGRAEDATAGPRSFAAFPSLLSASRVVLAPCFAWAIFSAPWLALIVACAAAVTDVVDGRMARLLGVESSRGAVLDVFGDAVFVLVGTAALAWAGVLSPVLPAAAAASLLALAMSWKRAPSFRAPRQGSARRLPDRIGHAAGILNYCAVLAGAGSEALGHRDCLITASQLVALVNLAPIALRRVDPLRGGAS